MILEQITGHSVEGVYFHCSKAGQGKTRTLLTIACELSFTGKTIFINDEDDLGYLMNLIMKRGNIVNPENLQFANLRREDWSNTKLINLFHQEFDHVIIDCSNHIHYDEPKYEIEWAKSSISDFKSVHISLQATSDGGLPEGYWTAPNVIYYEKVNSLIGLQIRGIPYRDFIHHKSNWYEFNAIS